MHGMNAPQTLPGKDFGHAVLLQWYATIVPETA